MGKMWPRLIGTILFMLFIVIGSCSSFECGTKKAKTSVTDPEIWPWQVIIYSRKNDTDVSGCSGTLIHERFVLTTKLCIGSGEMFFVRAGKYVMRVTVQVRYQQNDVRRIYIYDTEKNIKNDISILELESPMKFNDYVQPVCLNQVDDIANSVGTAVGFNFDKVSGAPTHVVSQQLPIVSYHQCLKKGSNFDSIRDARAFCAGFENGTAYCGEYSGSGLYIKKNNAWYIGGIATFSITYGSNSCNSETYLAFTNILYFLSWILNVTGIQNHSELQRPALTKNTSSANQYQNYAIMNKPFKRRQPECGVLKIQTKELITHGYDTYPGQFPWHVAIFHRKSKISTDYACGGSLISSKFVLTAAHCTKSDGVNQINTRRLVLYMGLHDIGVFNENVKQNSVYEIHTVPSEGKWSKLRNDIALLELGGDVEFTDYIQPICLNSMEISDNQMGIVVGWGLTKNGEISEVLQGANMPIINILECWMNHRETLGKILDYGMICAGYKNETGVCNGDSGGGLVVNRCSPTGCSWHLVGIVSFAAGNLDGTCRTGGFGAFTKVSMYLSWIETIINI